MKMTKKQRESFEFFSSRDWIIDETYSHKKYIIMIKKKNLTDFNEDKRLFLGKRGALRVGRSISNTSSIGTIDTYKRRINEI